jgi:hypothetical protein
MENGAAIFELDFKAGKMRVQRHLVANQTIYRVVFSDKRSPLVVTRALTDNASHWWTSIPEGRQREAEEIGILIANHIKANQS